MSNKNPGPTLFNSRFGGEQPIPPEFLAAMNRTESVTSVPNDEPLPPLSDTIVESELKTDRTDERSLRVVGKKSGNITLLTTNTNDNGLPVQVTRTLVPTGTTIPQPTATNTIAAHDLGNGWTIIEVGVEGTFVGGIFVPGVFSAKKFTEERPNVTPEEFRALIPTSTTWVDSAGTAIDPTLTGNELLESQEQVTQFKKRVEIQTQDSARIPAVLDKGKDTNPAKQNVAVVKTLMNEGAVVEVPTATKDVAVRQLGDGTKVQETREVPQVFSAKVFARERPNTVPEEFRAKIPIRTTRIDSEGQAQEPDMGEVGTTTLWQGAFTGANGTLLTAYVPEVGGSMIDVTGATYSPDLWQIQSNKAVENSGGRGRRMIVTPALGTSDYEFDVSVTIPNRTGAGASVSFRIISDLNYINFSVGSAPFAAYIYKLDAITETTLYRVDPPNPITNYKANSPIQLKIICSGATIQVLATFFEVDNTLHTNFDVFGGPVIVSDYLGGQKVGLWEANGPGDVTLYDDMLVTGVVDNVLKETQEQITTLTRRVEIVTQDTAPIPVSLVGKDTDQNKADITVTKTYRAEGANPLPTAVKDVVVENLGDGKVKETVRERPRVFPANVFERERPVLTPEKFRPQIPTITTSLDSAGGAVDPTLTGNEIRERQTQTTELTKRVEVSSQAQVTLPTTPLISKEQNEAKQIVTVSEQLRDGGGAAAIPSSTQEVDFRQVGDGTAVETIKTKGIAFAGAVVEKEIPDTVPPEFRAAGTETVTEQTIAGVVNVPVISLSGSEYKKSEQQVNLFDKRQRTLSHGTENPQLLDKKLDGVSAGGSLFNGLVAIQRFLQVGAQAIDSGFQVVSSFVKDLGNGKTLRETGTIDAFPTLIDSETDTVFGNVVKKTKTIVPAGTEAPADGTFVTVRALDKDRSLKTVDVLNQTSLLNYKLIFQGTTDVNLPPQLVSITGIVESSAGAGDFSENGNYTLGGNGSGGISLRGNCQGSAAILLDVSYDIKQLWGSNTPCKHFLFFVASDTSRAAILNKLTLFNGPTVNDWPKFVPKAVTIACHGEKVSGSGVATAQATDAVTTDYNGVINVRSASRTEGGGSSRDIGVSTKVIRIPPTIHSSFGIGGTVSGQPSFSAIASVRTGVNGGLLFGVNGFANGYLYISSGGTNTIVDATAGQSTIPTTGQYLHRLITEPHSYGFVRVHAEVIDFATLN